MKLVHKGESYIETYMFNTEQKYVWDIFTSQGVSINGKLVSVHMQEKEGSEYTVQDIPISRFPDLIQIVPLKHEYHIVLVYDVWGKVEKVTEGGQYGRFHG